MYCKHCGKEIADDSKFCQHCGGKLDKDVEVIKGEAPIDEITSKLFSNLNKKYLYAYIIWVIINTILLCLGDSDYSTNMFYPFTGYSYFDSSYYDLSEFITYVILIPLLLWLLVKTSYMEKAKSFVKNIKSYAIYLFLAFIAAIVLIIIAVSSNSEDESDYMRYYENRNRQTQQSEPPHESYQNSPSQSLNNTVDELKSQMDNIDAQMKDIQQNIQQQKIENLPSEYDRYYRDYP